MIFILAFHQFDFDWAVTSLVSFFLNNFGPVYDQNYTLMQKSKSKQRQLLYLFELTFLA